MSSIAASSRVILAPLLQHKRLLLRPDDIFLPLLDAAATHVFQNGEASRNVFVGHAGQKVRMQRFRLNFNITSLRAISCAAHRIWSSYVTSLSPLVQLPMSTTGQALFLIFARNYTPASEPALSMQRCPCSQHPTPSRPPPSPAVSCARFRTSSRAQPLESSTHPLQSFIPAIPTSSNFPLFAFIAQFLPILTHSRADTRSPHVAASPK